MTDLTARIPTTPETRDRIRRLKTGSESYEVVLTRLLDEHEEGLKQHKEREKRE